MLKGDGKALNGDWNDVDGRLAGVRASGGVKG